MASHRPENETPLTDTQRAVLEEAIERASYSGVSVEDNGHIIKRLRHQGVLEDLLASRHRELISALALKHDSLANNQSW